MFRWNLMLRPLFGSRPQQPKARRPRTTEKPQLEELTQRILPSASPLPAVFEASPPASPSVEAITSYIFSMMELRAQMIATLEQNVIGAYQALDQELAQEIYSVQQQWDTLFGINSSGSNPAPVSTVIQNGNASGAGQGHTSGSGSGSGTMTTAQDGNTQPLGTARPLDGGGGGGGGGSGSGSGSSSFNATVMGQVWLDNNGDGSLDDNEMDYKAAIVNLLYEVSSGGGGTWATLASTTTNSNLEGNNYSIGAVVPPGSSYTCEIEVVIPLYFGVETSSANNDVNAMGFSPEFSLSAGGEEVVPAALNSMNVNTLSDDPNGPVQQNTVTLRDAILTGNNGPPFPAITFNGTPGGTITPQKALDPIKTSYNINGPGSSTLTVNGNGNAGSIFTVNAGVTSTISGLTITGGTGANGGGIYNQGNLTLNGIILDNNQTVGNGGGIYNDTGAELNLQTVTIGTIGNPNQATQGGGGLYNLGSVTICCDSVIIGNSAGGGGGGIYNYEGTIQVFDDTEINQNSDSGLRGAGVYNNDGKFEMYGGYIANNLETKSDGGGVYNYYGTMTLTGIAVLANRAIGYGGGIYTNEGSLTLTSNVSIGSSAPSGHEFCS